MDSIKQDDKTIFDMDESPLQQQIIKKEKHKAIAKDFVFMSQMYKIKNLLNSSFQPPESTEKTDAQTKKSTKGNGKEQNASTFGDAVERITRKSQYGIFTNCEVINVCSKARIPIENTIEHLVPSQNKEYPSLQDILAKLYVKNSLLTCEQARDLKCLQ